jgi:hypothetical protein
MMEKILSVTLEFKDRLMALEGNSDVHEEIGISKVETLLLYFTSDELKD